MRSLILSLTLAAGCAASTAASPPPAAAPEPSGIRITEQDIGKLPAPAPAAPKGAAAVPFEIALGDAWEPDAGNGPIRIAPGAVGPILGWKHRPTGAHIALTAAPHDQADVDSTLEPLLGVMRENGFTSDGLKFLAPPLNGTIVGWTSKDGTERWRACARSFPNTDGPLTLLFVGRWPPQAHKAMAKEFDAACTDITLPRDP